MRFEFTYRIEDVREAVRTAVSPSGRRGQGARGVVGWLVFVVVAAALFYWMQAPRAGHVAQQAPELDLMVILIPALLPCVVLGVLLGWTSYKQFRARPTASRDPNLRAPTPPSATRGAKAVGMIIGGLMMVAVFWLVAPGPSIPVRLSRSNLVWIALCTVWAEIIVLVAYGKLSAPLAVRSQWRTKPGWRRAKVMMLDDAGFTVIDSHSRIEHHWNYFVKARETANLLVLHTEDSMMHLIPKRAIPEGELEQARALIQNGIPDCQFLVSPGGFAVVPKLPVPVQAISE